MEQVIVSIDRKIVNLGRLKLGRVVLIFYSFEGIIILKLLSKIEIIFKIFYVKI